MESELPPEPSSNCTDHESTQPDLNENSSNSSQTWKDFTFRITDDYLDHAIIRHHSTNLLKNPNTSILGDVCISIEGEKYILDRVILALRSNYFRICCSTKSDNLESFKKPCDYIKGGNDGVKTLISIIYGKDLKSVINKNNFLNLFHNMFIIGLEIDLEIIKQFLEETIKPEVNKFYRDIIDLQYFSSTFMGNYTYLSPTIVQFLSDNLLQIYRMIPEDLSGSEKELLILVLLNKSRNIREKRIIGGMCAEWICRDFRNRIQDLKDLVNATKYRFNLLPYCDLSSESMIKSLEKACAPGKSEKLEVEKYFNKLLLYHGEVNYDLPANLKAELCNLASGERIWNPIDETATWKSFLKDEFLCDVAINVQGTVFKLHRIKLLSASGFFYRLFVHPELSISSEQSKKKNDALLPPEEYSIDEIDPVTFKCIMQYIYFEEIEITSVALLMNVFKGSEFLEINDLFEKCISKMLEIALNSSVYFFEIFQFVCENDKYSELYNALVEQIVNSWSKLAEHPHFKDVSLHVLQEIIALPELKIDHSDQLLDLCSEWIFHDVKNRYQFTIEVAKAINRNFNADIQLSLETPSNSADCSQQYVKEQLIRVLSSAALIRPNVDAECGSSYAKQPCFILKCSEKVIEPREHGSQVVSIYHFDGLVHGEANYLTVVDVNFDEIVRLAQIRDSARWQCSATMIDARLFILFNIGDQFYFQVYHPITNVMTSLATDVQMNSRNRYAILNCNGEVFYCTDEILLRYSVELNRWITFLKDTRIENSFHTMYTSDGKKLYRTCVEKHKKTCTYVNKSYFFDLDQMAWMLMPEIPIPVKVARDVEGVRKFANIPFQINVINRDLSLLFESKTLVFHFVSQTWNSIDNSSKKVVQFTGQGQNIVYVSRDNEVHWFSPIPNKWTLMRKLSADFDRIVAIHVINE